MAKLLYDKETGDVYPNPAFQGHDTYLNGHSKGWPIDHSVDDTYECPPHTWKPPAGTPLPSQPVIKDAHEYSAAYTGSGKAILVLSTPDRTIAYFDTFADAQTAAEALNNLKGY